VAAETRDRFIVCEKCGVAYPAQYAACPRCAEEGGRSWKMVWIAVSALVVIYAVFRLSGSLPALF